MTGAAFGLLPPGVERVAHARAARLDGEIDDGGGAAERRRARAGFEIVARRGAAERHVEVRVGVDAAGDHVHAGGVDHLRSGADSGMPARPRDALALNQDVGPRSLAVTTVPLRISVFIA
jgi:hypothetical protein